MLLYQGVCNLWDGVVSMEAWLAGVRWDGLCAVWRTDAGELTAYVQRSGSLAHLAMYGTGHLPLGAGGQRSRGAGDERGMGARDGAVRVREPWWWQW